jgi:hypothetical protein
MLRIESVRPDWVRDLGWADALRRCLVQHLASDAVIALFRRYVLWVKLHPAVKQLHTYIVVRQNLLDQGVRQRRTSWAYFT